MARPPILYLLSGLPCSGKTTYARSLEASGVERVSVDDLLIESVGRLGVDYDADDHLELLAPIVEGAWRVVVERLAAGDDVVFDHGLGRRVERDEAKRLAEELGATWRLLCFDAALATLRERCAERAGQPDAVPISAETLTMLASVWERPSGEDELVITTDEEEVLQGGVANAGAVVRVGSHLLRPSNPHSAGVHRFLSALGEVGFDGAPDPIGIDPDGRERLHFIEGDVPVPPYPAWARSDAVLVSMVELLLRFHDASALVGVDPDAEWNPAAADPAGGRVVCHNDVCPENVVFRDGRAVALIDFEFAAPGRPVFDVAMFARMSIPIDDPLSAARLGWDEPDRTVARLRLVADTAGFGDDERALLVELIGRSIEGHGAGVRRAVEAGDPGYVAMWHAMGGETRLERRWQWWVERRAMFARSLVDE